MSDEKQKYTVWVEAEYWRPGEWIPIADSTDVVVTNEGQLFSCQEIEQLYQEGGGFSGYGL